MNIFEKVAPTDLPGYRKKSFALPYNGGEIWFEHMDGIYEHEELVLKKLLSDTSIFTKPSATSFLCFVFDETTVTESILNAVFEAVFGTKKYFQKIAFCGIDKMVRKKCKKLFCNKSIPISFFEGLEDAKIWLLPKKLKERSNTMKNKYTVFGIILTVLGLAFVAVALTNPQLSFPWPNWVSYSLYGLYVIYTVLFFCMSRLGHASFLNCIILALEFIALGLIVISIGIRNTPDDYNWYLPVGLGISVITQFANLYITKKRKEKTKQ